MKAKRICSLLLALSLLACAAGAAADTVSQTFPVHRRLIEGCRGEDVLCVAQKLYELGYLSAAPKTDDPDAAVYNSAIKGAAQKYESAHYIAPEDVQPLTSPAPELTAPVIVIDAVDGELTPDEQLGLLRVDPLLPAPDGLRLKADRGKVELTWSKVSRALTYNVYRDDRLIAATPDARYTDTAAAQGADHTYRVSTVTYSTEVSSEGVTEYLPYYYQSLKYNDLLRSPAYYTGQYIGLSRVSAVAQLSADDAADCLLVVRSGSSHYMVLLPGFYNDGWWADDMAPVSRFLPGDTVTVNGQLLGTASYTDDKGNRLTIPYISCMEFVMYN